MDFLTDSETPAARSLYSCLQQRRGRVLFVCYANSCRSQMAQAFARAYGRDVIEADSAGFVPAQRISRTARGIMLERHIDFAGHTLKSLAQLDLNQFDLIINLCEYALPRGLRALELRCPVSDPIGQDEERFRDVRDQIESMVRNLIATFRQASEPSQYEQAYVTCRTADPSGLLWL